jgi:hypothetical protein
VKVQSPAQSLSTLATTPDSDARSRLDKFGTRGTKLDFLRMYTSEAVKEIEDGSVDFIYGGDGWNDPNLFIRSL